MQQIKQQQPLSTQNKLTTTLGGKLIYHCTADIAQLSDSYPWQVNILFNNIAMTTSAIVIVFSQIPLIGLILIPIIAFTVYMNNEYQSQSQRLLKVQKKIQQNLLKSVQQIEQGIKFIYLFGKLKQFKQSVLLSVDKQINVEQKLVQLKRKLNAKYKLMMVVFLVVIVLSYGAMGLFYAKETQSDHQRNQFEAHLQQCYLVCSLDQLSMSRGI